MTYSITDVAEMLGITAVEAKQNIMDGKYGNPVYELVGVHKEDLDKYIRLGFAKPVLNPKRISELLGLSVATVRRQLRTGKYGTPVIRDGKCIGITEDELMAHVV